MGRRLSDEERGFRIVGEVQVRELGANGKCKLCKEAIKKGEKSLRYREIVFGRRQEVGMCMQCAVRFWKHAEHAVGMVSAAIQEFENQDPGSESSETYEDELVQSAPTSPVTPSAPAQTTVREENLVMDGDAIPDVARQDMEAIKRNREHLLREMGFEKS